jgi:hypothetical protein
MAYVPDVAIERLGELKPTAGRMFLQYCKHADQDTGECFPLIESVAESLGVRVDHAKEHERELVEKGWISVTPADRPGGRVVRILMGWTARADRRKRAGVTASKDADHFPNLGKSPSQDLVESAQNLVNGFPKLGENLPKVGEPYKEYNQPTNQPVEPTHEPAHTHAPVLARAPAMPSVGVKNKNLSAPAGSKHSLEVLEEYFGERARAGAKIDPAAVARARKKDGLEDGEVDRWLVTRDKSPPDISACPDCLGRGLFVAPDADWLGHQVCKHPNLKLAS